MALTKEERELGARGHQSVCLRNGHLTGLKRAVLKWYHLNPNLNVNSEEQPP